MAYASLVSFAQTIENMIQNHHQYSTSLRYKHQFTSLHERVILLQSFLEDFPQKANSDLEGRIRDAANDAEDIVEYFMWKLIQSRFRSNKWRATSARSQFKFHLKRVGTEIESIVKKVMEIKSDSTESVQLEVRLHQSASSRHGANADVVGLDDDLMAIKSRLCGESPKLQVIPIVGMGGIGKTTLARYAFDDALAAQHFDIRAWISVSQDYKKHEILAGLVVSVKRFIKDGGKQGTDEEKVYKTLKGRRYLIVMDDMWGTKAWDDISYLFPDDSNGSRIMLTTRLLDVAAYPDPFSHPHELHLMDADLSWDLLRKKVFKDEDYPSELKSIGKEIARNCRGLPLALVVIAGILSAVSKTTTSWCEIADNVNSAIKSKEEHFEKILSLSYSHLPHRLKPCFLYMGGFPEDHEIRVSKLTKLWIAGGFLRSSNGSKSLEEEAENCLEDLVNRNLVLRNKKKSDGKIKSCSLHDLMRDMCIRKGREEKFLPHFGTRYLQSMSSTYYMCSVSLEHTYDNLPTLKNIHTIICKTLFISLKSFKLIRILDVMDVYIDSEADKIFELFHLRYLAIRCWNKNIPAAISNLQNLQTLIIRSLGMSVNHLPHEIWRMPQLRHLVFHGRLPIPKGAACTLVNLQTLSLVSPYSCALAYLNMTPNLKKLGIDCSHYQDSAYLHNLVHLLQLESLELMSDTSVCLRKHNITFPQTLKRLTLSGLSFPWKDMSVVGSLPNLQVLKIRKQACQGRIWATTEGEFLQLEFLLIEAELVTWITESSHFPRLKSLVLHSCLNLREVPEGIGEIPTLELIEIKGRRISSLVQSAKQIQEEQESWGNDALHVYCI